MLDLAPTLERQIVDRAEANGLTTDQYLAKLLSAEKPQPSTPWQAPPPDRAPEAQRAAIHALLTLPKEEIAQRNATSIALLQTQLAQAAKATPEEIVKANAEWEVHKQRMNENRAITGERPLFAEGNTPVSP